MIYFQCPEYESRGIFIRESIQSPLQSIRSYSSDKELHCTCRRLSLYHLLNEFNPAISNYASWSYSPFFINYATHVKIFWIIVELKSWLQLRVSMKLRALILGLGTGR
jgi:hypothetical protein